ncbi:beta-lactamase family protein [Annulohypoxylon maeteangense]|uniref:beta-lactamase family protein n=1 Tax=Annulohypoxylon maeteangense TaxID=1927788 RepID=UPI002008BC54|nr:beta-lactamase family protein [Annulohypoxylon maeteangense]KAI0884640.1 beta-lactamase family protein [Annulohypoxylon maeteangense]
MSTFEEQATKAVENSEIPGIVAIAKDKDGNLNYSKTFSRNGGTVYKEDSVLAIASMTKLMTSIAAVQLVERGLITLDEDVTPLLPSLAKLEILTGFADDGTAITHKRTKPITLRTLLTHSSGVAYGWADPLLLKYIEWKKPDTNADTIDEAFDQPLVFEPGEGFTYSSSLDRTGQLIEKLTGLGLEEYMKKNIWDPLGMTSTTFSPREHPDIQARKVPMGFRDDKTGAAVETGEPGWFEKGATCTQAFGGHGAYSTMADYIKVLHSLLVDDEKLLKKETAALFFQPQLTPASKAALLKLSRSGTDWTIGTFPETDEYDWGLGGILIDGDKHEFRRRNTLIWSGAANTYWFIDRDAGVCGVFGIQILPTFDAKAKDLITAFEEDVYRRAGKL